MQYQCLTPFISFLSVNQNHKLACALLKIVAILNNLGVLIGEEPSSSAGVSNSNRLAGRMGQSSKVRGPHYTEKSFQGPHNHKV
jgi:hypothetical protein